MSRKTWTANRPNWAHGQKTVTAAGTAEQLPSQAIPDGFDLVVRALLANGGAIYLGNSQDEAESSTAQIPFTAGNGLTLRVRNVNMVWVDALVSGEGVDYWVEV
ncbi:hypothetical protein LCGC14_1982740 [marine sediment metagenome]|uniref:Uncharacterized protein n=1 Tax=marine sediment metagenome TaxID=412755 RepID=A0A0F9FWL4_9ZZZZ